MDKPKSNDERFAIKAESLLIDVEALETVADEWMTSENEIIQKVVTAGVSQRDAEREFNLRNFQRHQTRLKVARLIKEAQHKLGILNNAIDQRIKTTELMKGN